MNYHTLMVMLALSCISSSSYSMDMFGWGKSKEHIAAIDAAKQQLRERGATEAEIDELISLRFDLAHPLQSPFMHQGLRDGLARNPAGGFRAFLPGEGFSATVMPEAAYLLLIPALIQAGGDPNTALRNGSLALLLILNNYARALNLLVSYPEFNPNCLYEGGTSLMNAIGLDRQEAIQILLASVTQVDLNVERGEDRQTALAIARACENSREIIQLLEDYQRTRDAGHQPARRRGVGSPIRVRGAKPQRGDQAEAPTLPAAAAPDAVQPIVAAESVRSAGLGGGETPAQLIQRLLSDPAYADDPVVISAREHARVERARRNEPGDLFDWLVRHPVGGLMAPASLALLAVMYHMYFGTH